MGMGPVYNQLANPPANQQRQQDYMQQFNNAAYAPIPGVRGQQPLPPPAQTGTFNGRPIDPNYTPGSYNGWGSRSMLGTSLLPGIRSEFMNGTLSDADWQTFLPGGAEGGPGQVAGQMQNHMVRPQPPPAMSGPYGQQAALLAGLLGQRGGAASYGGLLGGPKRGYRIPGGK